LFQRQKQGVTYLFSYKGEIVGYTTIAMSAISANRLTAKHKREIYLLRYPSLLIGRLGVDNNWRKKGIGGYICDWCTGLALEFSTKIGCRYVILQTSEENIEFYKKCGFKKAKVLDDDRKIWLYQRLSIE